MSAQRSARCYLLIYDNKMVYSSLHYNNYIINVNNGNTQIYDRKIRNNKTKKNKIK